MEKKIKNAKLTLLVICVIYFSLSVLAIISEFNINTNDSEIGKFTFYALVRVSWWPLSVTALMVMAHILYSKKYMYAAITEIILGIILLINVIRNIVSYGNSFLASTLSFILPAIFIYQGATIVMRKKDDKLEIPTEIKKPNKKTVIKKKTAPKVSSRKERR